MAKSRLTAASVEKLKPPATGQVEVFDVLLPSFGIRLSHSGTRAWFVMTRVNGRLRRFTLGRYPAMPLEAARKEARSAIEQAQRGVDRQEARVEARRAYALEAKDRFGGRVDQFFAEYVSAKGLRPSTIREYKRILRGPDTAFLRDNPIRKVSKSDIQQVLSAMQERGSHGAADRAKAYMSKFFAWCVDQEIIDASPVARIRLHRQGSRDAAGHAVLTVPTLRPRPMADHAGSNSMENEKGGVCSWDAAKSGFNSALKN
ncbi:MAG: integrase family protein [Hyphomicrobiales bacterium]